jgi:hypothetical protein
MKDWIGKDKNLFVNITKKRDVKILKPPAEAGGN